MISRTIQRKLFRTVLLCYISMNVAAAYRQGENGQCAQLLFRIIQGVRSQRRAFKSLRAKTALDCVLFCFDEKTCTSFNFAEYSPDNDAHANCQLQNEASSNDENSKEFLRDERYAFYRVRRASHESENDEATENVTTQIFNRTSDSCLGHFNNGSKTSGYYTIVVLNDAYTVYCDMESEPGFVWTLVMSFTRKNKHHQSFISRAMYENGVRNKLHANWDQYRMNLNLMYDIKKNSTHWRVTCSFPQHGVSNHKDYVRAAFADFDLMAPFWNECKKVDYISVMGQSCSECTAHWWQGNGTAPHIAAVQTDVCDIKSDKSGNNYFGAYTSYNTTFRCTESLTSSTNYWFGAKV